MIAQPFTLPDDGWFQISAIGDFPHATTGLVQVIDADAVSAIVQKFAEESTKPNFPGVLVDWDHASLDLDKPTEAAGWIMNLQQRPDGLWGQVRWSDRGAEAISGGRYRFMSPVWRQEDCLALGEKKVRPLRLFNCALTSGRYFFLCVSIRLRGVPRRPGVIFESESSPVVPPAPPWRRG